MSSFGRHPQRDFSPVDTCDVRFESPRSSHTRLLAKPLREIDEEKGHQYEDPSGLSDQVRALQGGEKNRRKRFNDLYEPHVPLKELRVTRKRDMSESSDYSDSYTRESCLNRCILFFVLLTSVTALILVVLMMLGKVGPAVERCACVNTEPGSYSKKGKYNLLFTKSQAVDVLQSILLHEYFSFVILKKIVTMSSIGSSSKRRRSRVRSHHTMVRLLNN